MRISGSLIVRDGIAHGYPFLEAIQSALPICDEFVVGDGASTDGTWEALGALRDAYPERVRLYREAWPGEDIAALTRATNRLLRHCRFDYCLHLQANEILHEAARDEIRELPELYPTTDLFRLPFLNVMGRSLTWFVDFRRRLFRNRPYIASLGDAYDVGYRVAALWRDPQRLWRFMRHRSGERTIYLPKPIFRYRAIFPRDYLTKLETRQRLTGAATSPELTFARRVWHSIDPRASTPDAFWLAMRPFFESGSTQQRSSDDRLALPRRCLRSADAHGPAIVQPLFDAWQYPVAESLARLRHASTEPGAPAAVDP